MENAVNTWLLAQSLVGRIWSVLGKARAESERPVYELIYCLCKIHTLYSDDDDDDDDNDDDDDDGDLKLIMLIVNDAPWTALVNGLLHHDFHPWLYESCAWLHFQFPCEIILIVLYSVSTNYDELSHLFIYLFIILHVRSRWEQEICDVSDLL